MKGKCPVMYLLLLSQRALPLAAFPRAIMPAKSLQIRRWSFLLYPVILLLSQSRSQQISGREYRPNSEDVKEFKSLLKLTQIGAFTPGCSVRHLPGYIEKYNVFKEKGVDVVAVIASNDAWVVRIFQGHNRLFDIFYSWDMSYSLKLTQERNADSGTINRWTLGEKRTGLKGMES